MISYDEFSKIDLRVATIISAEPVSGSEKLLKLTVDLGEKRVIVAGLGKNYAPEELVGRQIIIVANLDPRQLMGIESQGMLLAAESSNGPVPLTVDQTCLSADWRIDPGAKIR